jgi:hypothetical protein
VTVFEFSWEKNNVMVGAEFHELMIEMKDRLHRSSMPRQTDGGAEKGEKGAKHQKHTTPGIRWSSPTQLLIWLSRV